MSLRYPTSDVDVKQIVRDETSYENTDDELPSQQLDTIVERAKGRIELLTGNTNWYSTDGLGYALAAYACMRSKAAVENVPLSDYSLGDTDVSFSDTDPDTSQQLNQWAEDVAVGFNDANVQTSDKLKPKNSSEYIGETYYKYG